MDQVSRLSPPRAFAYPIVNDGMGWDGVGCDVLTGVVSFTFNKAAWS